MRNTPLVISIPTIASGAPRISSDSFITMPNTLEIPPNGKCSGTLKTISTLRLAGSILSGFGRTDIVMLRPRSGISSCVEWLAGRRRGFPDLRAGVALTAIVCGVLFIERCALGPGFLRPINGTRAGSRGASRQMWIDTAYDLRLELSRVVLRWSLRVSDENGPELVPIIVT